MILIGTDDGLYRWFEGCGWPIFHSLQGRQVAALASPGAGELVVLDRLGAILESVDNGQSWRSLPTAEGAGAPTALAVGGEPSSILLATRSPLGMALRAIGAPIPRRDEPDGGFAPRLARRARTLAEGATAILAPGGKVVRVDPETIRGKGWTPLEVPDVRAPGHLPEVHGLAVGGGSPAVWFACVREFGLWRSADLGASWTSCPGLPPRVNAIRPISDQPGRLVAATSDGCWVSGDSGQTWEDRSGGLESRRYVSSVAVKPGEPDVMLAGAAPRGPDGSSSAPFAGLEFSLYETTDGGKTWAIVRRGNPDVLEHDTIADIRHDPAAPDNVIVALSSGELWVTRNGGAYWAPLARQIRAARVLCGVG